MQQRAHKRIAEIVSKCLETVFAQPYELRIAFERKRGKTEARLSFWRDDLEVDPLEGAGGGIVDVAAFALRLACLVLSKPSKRMVLILDEPFKGVDVVNRKKVREMMNQLARQMHIQFIMVTQIADMGLGKVIELPS